MIKNEMGHRIDIIEVANFMNTEKENLIVKGIEVSYKRINEEDYICINSLSEDEIKDIIASMEDKSMPSVMKHFKANYAGKVDMSLVNKIARG